MGTPEDVAAEKYFTPPEPKPKTKEEWITWSAQWDESDHAGKVKLCEEYGINYGSGRHWRSDCGIPFEPKEKPKTLDQPIPTISQVNTPYLLNTGRDMITVAVIGDTHNPYQDNDVMRLVENFLEEIQPDYLIYNGDINDFYQVSVFAKDPARLGQLQSDLDVTHAMFSRHQLILPNTKKIMVDGTHEHRWINYLQKQSPATANLRVNTIPGLYELDKYNIDHVTFERGVLINKTFLILHGDIASIHSSYTAKRHYEKHGGNGMANHTHRGGSYFKHDRFGFKAWFENFCLCSLLPDYIQNPDWMNGFSLIHFKDNHFYVEQLPIVSGSFIYGGKLWKL